jgi:hypothetical protein
MVLLGSLIDQFVKGLSFIPNRQRLKEGMFCVLGLAGIEPTPARSGRAGYACLKLSDQFVNCFACANVHSKFEPDAD